MNDNYSIGTATDSAVFYKILFALNRHIQPDTIVYTAVLACPYNIFICGHHKDIDPFQPNNLHT
jgi:hypothetical protein